MKVSRPGLTHHDRGVACLSCQQKGPILSGLSTTLLMGGLGIAHGLEAGRGRLICERGGQGGSAR